LSPGLTVFIVSGLGGGHAKYFLLPILEFLLTQQAKPVLVGISPFTFEGEAKAAQSKDLIKGVMDIGVEHYVVGSLIRVREKLAALKAKDKKKFSKEDQSLLNRVDKDLQDQFKKSTEETTFQAALNLVSEDAFKYISKFSWGEKNPNVEFNATKTRKK
jgi:hypothetical protein